MTTPAPARVDLYTTIHKAIRAQLFDVATEAARVDLRSTVAVNLLAERVARVLGFLEDHAHHEDTHVLPAVHAVAPEVATSLDIEHRMLDGIQAEVAAAAAALVRAEPAHRAASGLALMRQLNRLIAAHLSHMGREETEANAALWCGYDDAALGGIQGRLIGSIPAARMAEWQEIMMPALNPVERALVTGGAVE